MAKYHVNPETGRANICKAQVKCPLGEGAPHFDSKEKAKEYVELIAKQNGSTFIKISKNTSNKNNDEIDSKTIKIKSLTKKIANTEIDLQRAASKKEYEENFTKMKRLLSQRDKVSEELRTIKMEKATSKSSKNVRATRLEDLQNELDDVNQQLYYARNERIKKRPFDYEISNEEVEELNLRKANLLNILNQVKQINTGDKKEIFRKFDEPVREMKELEKIRPPMGKQLKFPYGSVVEINIEAQFKTTKGLFGRTKREKVSDAKVIRGRIIGSNKTNFTVRDNESGIIYKSGKDFYDYNVNITAPSPYTAKNPDQVNEEYYEEFKKNYKIGDYINLSNNFEVDEDRAGVYTVSKIENGGRVTLTNTKDGRTFTLDAKNGDFTPLINWNITRVESSYSNLYEGYNDGVEGGASDSDNSWRNYYNGETPYPLSSGRAIVDSSDFVDA